MPFNPLYSLSGLFVGLLVGQTGVGGGSLMTPLLILLFGVHPHTAVGTDLLFAAVTKSTGTLVHGLNKTVNWSVVWRLAAGSVPATGATLFLMSRLDLRAADTSVLVSTVLGVALILTAISLVFRRQLLALAADRIDALSAGRVTWLTVLTGAVLGVLVSLSSVGAGALGVTVLIFLYPRTPLAQIVGSDIAHAVPLTLCAGVGHWLIGSVDLPLLGSLLLGSIPGIVVGSQLAARVPEWALRPALAVMLAVVGGTLVV
ncbi:MAG: sulfite exporter TauE/SafE family protein [Solirubrobacterales bacterium]|nr:sulfite exporter TauE/SafE family protein [Solirubrobacterales bacterium]